MTYLDSVVRVPALLLPEGRTELQSAQCALSKHLQRNRLADDGSPQRHAHGTDRAGHPA
jgi:hypothetical protein